jgi:CBS domain containing-hemolysin-like protein
MSTADGIALVVAVLLVPLGGILAAVDSALARVSVARVEEFVRDGRPGAKALQRVVETRARYTNLLLMLRLTCELTATVLVTIVARAWLGSSWPVPVLTVALMVFISYALVGVGPRTIGRQHPNRVALAGAPAVYLLGRVFGPLASLLTLVGNALTPGRGFRDGPFSSEVELRELVDMAEQRGVVEHGERQMIQSVFELGDTIAREVMVPRTEIVWIERAKSVPQAMALALRSGFSRIPVIGENLDDVVGITYLKDLARRGQDAERAPIERIDEDTARVTARLAVEDLEEIFPVELPDRDDVETVGGLLAEALGRVPIPGASAVVHGLELTAEDVGGRRNRIDTILVRRVHNAEDEVVQERDTEAAVRES